MFPKRQIIFSQGNEAYAVFYFQEGKVKLSVVSQQGKEAIVAILERAAFFWGILSRTAILRAYFELDERKAACGEFFKCEQL